MTAVATALVTAGAWVGIEAAGRGQATAIAVAGIVATVLVTLGGVWVSQAREAALPVSTGTAWRLIRVGTCSPADVSVHPAIEPPIAPPPYVRRDFDDYLHERLEAAKRGGGFLLLSGGSSTGKSRSLLDGLTRVMKGWLILLPESPQALRNAITGDAIKPRTVIWLDDTPTERFITATGDGLTLQDLHNTLNASKPVLVVDLMWTIRYDALTFDPDDLGIGDLSPGDPARDCREVLRLAGQPIRVPETFSRAERERAQALAVTDKRLAAALADTQFGVTQALAGAPVLIRHYLNSEHDMPCAYAIINAAIDARRLDYQVAVSRDFLRTACIGYLTDRQLAEVLAYDHEDDSWFTKSLTYASDSRRRPGRVAPLVVETVRGTYDRFIGYRVADFLLEYALPFRQLIPVPGSTLEALQTYGRLATGLALWLYQHDHIGALRLRADAGDVQAQELLASWLLSRGLTEELRQRADDGDFHARRCLVTWHLGRGNVDEAITALRPLADAGDSAARHQLAMLLSEQGRIDEAIRAIRPLADAGDSAARHQLAMLLSEQGRIDEAVTTIRPLAEAGDEVACRQLAIWLVELDQIDELRARAYTGDEDASGLFATWLAEHNQIDELRKRANIGDQAAQRVLASWLAVHDMIDELRVRGRAGDHHAQWRVVAWALHQGRTEQAISEITVLADAGDEQAEEQLASLLLEHGEVGRLRRRADAGADRSRQLLDYWLFDNGRLDELRVRAVGGDEHAVQLLAFSPAGK